jgi:hypothetical protein
VTVLLIANIGNRDVWVDEGAPIPGEVNPQWNKSASRRALGRALQHEWAACRPYLRLPIIGKAVDHARGEPGPPVGVVLVSSDQSGREDVSRHHLAQDTCELAPVVERLLIERHGIAAEAITHWTVTGNPADYGGMQAFFRQHLSALREEHPQATLYLEVSGGTPAMTSMLLTVGAQIFGLDARPLYVSEHEERPFPLDLGRRMVADSLIRTVKANLDIYAYHAAAQTARHNLALLREFVPADPLLAALEYARQRRNFDFKEAWETSASIADLEWGRRLRAIAADAQELTPATLLRESIFSARLAYETGNLFDFVVRVFQFVEGAWRTLALKLGVQFEHNGKPNPYGKELAAQWVQDHQSLIDGLVQDGVRLETVNRYVLDRLVSALHEQIEGQPYQEALAVLRRLEQVGDLRNRVVHQYHRITLELLRDTYYAKKRERKHHPPEDAIDIVQAMKAVWSTATGRPLVGPNPYDVINHLILDMLA